MVQTDRFIVLQAWMYRYQKLVLLLLYAARRARCTFLCNKAATHRLHGPFKNESKHIDRKAMFRETLSELFTPHDNLSHRDTPASPESRVTRGMAQNG